MRIFDAITELTEKIDCFDQGSLERIGAKAKKLNKDLDETLTRLQAMETINYDKNKIDFLYDILEKFMES